MSFELGSDVSLIIDTLKLFYSKKINVLSCVIQGHPGYPYVNGVIFLDITKSNISSNELEKRVRALSYASRLAIIERGFTHGEARIIAFPLEDLHNILASIKSMGEPGYALLYHLGFNMGKDYVKKVSLFFSRYDLLKYLLLCYQGMGFGEFNVSKYVEGKESIVEARDLFECIGVASSEPNSHLFRGILAGIFSELWGDKVKVIEEKCIAKGDSKCVFKVEKV
ncbi:MAG: hypothetical protein DRJ52_08590 [Thermoprotei archaeon]|nr:MAG: hypothetical protein DRJ52_08590 [Thermoprotei archaeon]RLE98727.1 MAG: hypothetical protein DRJ63_07280 [Thermoprotei archaeon]